MTNHAKQREEVQNQVWSLLWNAHHKRMTWTEVTEKLPPLLSKLSEISKEEQEWREAYNEPDLK